VEKHADGSAVIKGTERPVTVGPSIRMSKSKKNTVAPMSMIDLYGADAIRWFMLSDSPPERDVDWSEAGAEGCWRFVQRIWTLMETKGAELPPIGTSITDTLDERSTNLRRLVHRRISEVTEHLTNLRFNRVVANLYDLANVIGTIDVKFDAAVRREALESLVLMLGPMMPHLAETCWEALGHKTLLVDTPWPVADAALTRADSVTYAVQVNGKLRVIFQTALGTDSQAVQSRALALPEVVRALEGKTPKRVIVVPNRMVSVVV
jgi:leucyl-tRNA synthetase